MVVVLLSGGADSTLLAERAHRAGTLHSCHFFHYGQPAGEAEWSAAKAWGKTRGVHVERTDLALPGVSAMQIGSGVPGPRVLVGRNLVLLSLAVSRAAAVGASEVQFGANADDQADYIDCRGSWVDALSACALGCAGVRVAAPLVGMTKGQILGELEALGVALESTWSCYQPAEWPWTPCGTCNACVLRASRL